MVEKERISNNGEKFPNIEQQAAVNNSSTTASGVTTNPSVSLS